MTCRDCARRAKRHERLTRTIGASILAMGLIAVTMMVAWIFVAALLGPA